MSKADLKPCRTPEEAKVRGRNGGLASGAARRRKRNLRELVRLALDAEHRGLFDEEFNGMRQGEVIAAKLVRQAAAGSLPAMKLLFNLEAETVRPDVDAGLEDA